jgi:hypothetical protein
MQWHWGNIGSFLAGLSTVVIALTALKQGPAALRVWRDKQVADAEEARARSEALRADTEERRLERRRTLLGWSPGGVETYTVALITDPDEMDHAKVELTGGGPTSYVVLRVDEGDGAVNRGRSLRILIEEQRFLCRPPTAAEREALEAGFKALGIRDLPPSPAGAPSWY